MVLSVLLSQVIQGKVASVDSQGTTKKAVFELARLLSSRHVVAILTFLFSFDVVLDC